MGHDFLYGVGFYPDRSDPWEGESVCPGFLSFEKYDKASVICQWIFCDREPAHHIREALSASWLRLTVEPG